MNLDKLNFIELCNLLDQAKENRKRKQVNEIYNYMKYHYPNYVN